MKVQDLFNRPILQLTSHQSVDVSRFLHAQSTSEPHTWTFTGPGSNEWSTIQRGRFNEAARNAVKEYCNAYRTRYARIILTSMEPY